MANISKVTLPNGSTYDIKDTTARSQITSEAATRKAADDSINNTINNLKLNLTGAMHYVGVTITELSDGKTLPATHPDNVIILKDDHGDSEHNYKPESGDVTPSGTVSKPTFTGTAGTVNVSVRVADIINEIELKNVVGTYDTASSSYTDPTSPESNRIMSTIVSPTAHVSGGKVTNTLTTASIKQVNTVGTLPTFSATVDNETLSFNFNAGSLPTTANTSVVTGVSSTLTNPTVEVSPFNIYGYDHSIKDIPATGTFTPQGTVSQPIFTGNVSTVTVK